MWRSLTVHSSLPLVPQHFREASTAKHLGLSQEKVLVFLSPATEHCIHSEQNLMRWAELIEKTDP